MSMVGIVVLSILGGMLALALVASIAALVWLAFEMRRAQSALRNELVQFKTDVQKILTDNEAQLKSAIDAAKAAFASVRNDTRTLLEEDRKQAAATLEEHRKAMHEAIDKINAEALAASAAKSIQASLRMEKAVTVFTRFVQENLERTANDYGPDDYAPEATEFGGPPSGFSLSQSARLDAEVEQEQAALISTGSGEA